MFIITITFHSPITTMKGLHEVSHYPGETAIRIDCNQLGSIPNTNLGVPTMVAFGHLWYNLGPHFVGSISAAQSRLPFPWAHVWLLAHPYYHLECALL